MNKQVLQSIGFFILFCLLLTVSVLGVSVPRTGPVVSVGPMQASAFDDGISLYQSYRGVYYTVSPFNDYVITQDGRSSYISKEAIDSKDYTVSFSTNPLITIPQVVGAYLFNRDPSLRFTTDGEIMHYTATANGDELTVTSQINDQIPPDPQKLGITLAYHSDDLVFDDTKTVYSFWDNTDLATFKQIYGYSLKPSQDHLMITVPSGHIFLMNPNLSGLIEVKAEPGQQLIINRNAKLIEVVQPAHKDANGTYSAVLHVQTFESPREVLK